MAAIIAYSLSGAIALSILLIAVGLLSVPHMAAAGFGVAVRPDPRWDACPSTKVVSRHRIRSVHGDPDSQSGCSLACWFMLAATSILLADAAIVLRDGPTRAVAFVVHGATAAVMLTISGFLLLD